MVLVAVFHVAKTIIVRARAGCWSIAIDTDDAHWVLYSFSYPLHWVEGASMFDSPPPPARLTSCTKNISARFFFCNG
jgi:hypothetical protein